MKLRKYLKEMLGALLVGAILPFMLYFELPITLRMALPFWAPIAMSAVGAVLLFTVLIGTSFGRRMKALLR